MKPLYKVGVGTLALAVAGLTVWSAAANILAVSGNGEGTLPGDGEGHRAREKAAEIVPANGAVQPASHAASAERAQDVTTPAVEDPIVAVPGDLHVTVKKTAAGPIVSLRRQGHVVAVMRGKERRVGMSSVEWASMPGEATSLVWETTHEKTLETVRGEMSLADDGKVAVQRATLPAVITSESSNRHTCRGHGDGAGGFVVVCRVSGAAAAANVEGDDTRRGVWQQAGDRTLVRFDLPMEGDGVETRVIGYEKGGKGVLVRVEASRAPGESAPVLAILSDSRSQPQPVRRNIGCFCRLPARDF